MRRVIGLAVLLAPAAFAAPAPGKPPGDAPSKKDGTSPTGSAAAPCGGGLCSDPAGDVKPLRCPKGFKAVVDTGPHLKLPKKGKGRKSADLDLIGDPKDVRKNHVARRCVPDKPAKKSPAAPAASSP